MQTTEYIPTEKLELFHECLVACKGYYRGNPYIVNRVRCDEVCVTYIFDEVYQYRNFHRMWKRVNTPIVEKMRQLPFHRRLAKKISACWLYLKTV